MACLASAGTSGAHCHDTDIRRLREATMRPVHFEIHATDPERAVAFYGRVFGWKFERWGEIPYWLITTGDTNPGIDGGLVPRQGAAR
jgi:predicted enzyme related to lactoylglutathione lyase